MLSSILSLITFCRAFFAALSLTENIIKKHELTIWKALSELHFVICQTIVMVLVILNLIDSIIRSYGCRSSYKYYLKGLMINGHVYICFYSHIDLYY